MFEEFKNQVLAATHDVARLIGAEIEIDEVERGWRMTIALPALDWRFSLTEYVTEPLTRDDPRVSAAAFTLLAHAKRHAANVELPGAIPRSKRKSDGSLNPDPLPQAVQPGLAQSTDPEVSPSVATGSEGRSEARRSRGRPPGRRSSPADTASSSGEADSK